MEKCKTLGSGTSQSKPPAYFKFSYSTNELTLNYGYSKPKQISIIVDDKFIFNVIQRVEYLNTYESDHLRQASYYTTTHWPGCEKNRPSPYVAKLILDVFPEEIIERIKNKYTQH